MTTSARLSSEVLRDRFRGSAMMLAFVFATPVFFFFATFFPLLSFFGCATISGTIEGASDKGEDAQEGDETVGVPSLEASSTIKGI